jgi:hypothetical protein
MGVRVPPFAPTEKLNSGTCYTKGTASAVPWIQSYRRLLAAEVRFCATGKSEVIYFLQPNTRNDRKRRTSGTSGAKALIGPACYGTAEAVPFVQRIVPKRLLAAGNMVGILRPVGENLMQNSAPYQPCRLQGRQ